ncbi:hypothetical protein [Pelosinus baikalensis]|uniref:Uncharacterized protein n=1 Tax=Pelosinus baikalensis TaxID=2892015 RepID=A0ABS8HS58_9FIRM|nr:hypothetical protein [Pelosinus baikalensis]MCC5466011.1 hypothetical protein [Pelosinus baikalensis]
MKGIVKKIAIYSMVGIMQVGFGASIIEASPLQNNPTPMQLRYDRHDQGRDRHDRERWDRERQRQERLENERHERAMKRRPHETRKQWRERQKHEIERHERELRNIREHRHR